MVVCTFLDFSAHSGGIGLARYSSLWRNVVLETFVFSSLHISSSIRQLFLLLLKLLAWHKQVIWWYLFDVVANRIVSWKEEFSILQRPKVAPHPDISDSDGSLHISSFLPHQLLGIIIKTFLMHAVDKRISIL